MKRRNLDFDSWPTSEEMRRVADRPDPVPLLDPEWEEHILPAASEDEEEEEAGEAPEEE